MESTAQETTVFISPEQMAELHTQAQGQTALIAAIMLVCLFCLVGIWFASASQ